MFSSPWEENYPVPLIVLGFLTFTMVLILFLYPGDLTLLIVRLLLSVDWLIDFDLSLIDYCN